MVRTILILLAAIGIASCEAPSVTHYSTVDATVMKLDSDRIGSGRVYNFTLKDGTHCIYVDGIREGGLSCNFTMTRYGQ